VKVTFSLKGYGKCRMCAASQRLSTLKYGYISGKCGKPRNFCLLSMEKMKCELLLNILVTRNPNWSQRSGTEIGSVKGRY